jgi:orotate phosphoribosyltransferase
MNPPRRSGHFSLESGFHTDAWFDLDSVLHDSRRLQACVEALAERLSPHDMTTLCGPETGGALVARAVAQRLGLRSCSAGRLSAGSGSGLFTARYQVAGEARDGMAGEKVALVDDALSAGSAVRATFEDLTSLGARVVVVGAIWILGDRGARWVEAQSVPLVSVERAALPQWSPAECPLCVKGVPLTRAS